MADYEYVIVGGGSAGCVLANRLSRDHDVLLLEAGTPDEKREISIPIAHVELLQTDVDWGFRTTPQSALDDRRVYLPQGKTLGGSSSINGQMYFRGHPADYDAWAAATGNDEWGSDAVLRYYDRLEDGDGPHYGTGGPQRVTGQDDPHPLSEAFVDAAAASGLRRQPCLNTEEMAGVGFTDVVQKDGERYSAADAFLKPVLDRPTLTAETGARADRILFDGDRATGVRYRQDGERREATVSEEVLVAAGAINSPRLLLLSGIGPADHLREHGIDLRADVPGVGRNLHDHVIVWTNDETSSNTYDDADSILNLLQYLLLKRGPLTSNGSEAAGFWRSADDLDAPDVQFLFAPATIERNGLADPDRSGFSIATALVHPKSRGRLTLTSADPRDPPRIDPGYLTHDDDVEALVRGVTKAREIADADPLARYRDGRSWPREDGEAAVRDHVREHALSYYHLVGTCKMGDGAQAVVDDRLRVRGVDDLRVVDASVMPTIPRANTHGPTMMVAERASDLLTPSNTSR